MLSSSSIGFFYKIDKVAPMVEKILNSTEGVEAFDKIRKSMEK